MKPTFLKALVTLAATLMAASSQTIDFESVPGLATPIDMMGISNQFAAVYGVVFSFEGGGNPYLAKVGAPRTAFAGPGGADAPAANQGVGNFFLTDSKDTNAVGVPPAPLLITYVQPVAAASGVIIDIDSFASCGGDEQWLFEARNATNGVIDTTQLTTTSFNAGDGLATPWKFQHASADIYSVRVTFVGHKTNCIGLAFDNFSPALPIAPPYLSISMTQGVARVGIAGTIGSSNRVEYLSSLSSTNWSPLTNIVLSRTPQFFIDSTSSNATRRYYRAIGSR